MMDTSWNSPSSVAPAIVGGLGGLGMDGSGPLARPEHAILPDPPIGENAGTQCPFHRCRRCGNFAMFTTILLASSCVSDRRPLGENGGVTA